MSMTTSNKEYKIGGEKQQKAIGTYCIYNIKNGDSVVKRGIVEVHTQGTSTLDYPVPNFAFTFYTLVLNTTTNQYELKKEKVNLLEYGLSESTLTAKADSMDSSHLNNTPTCIFFNNLIDELIEDKQIQGSYPRLVPGKKYLDAIAGEPCIIEYYEDQGDQNQITTISDLSTQLGSPTQDIFESKKSSLINLGSFMLNIDKSGKSLGLDIIDDETENSKLKDLPLCKYLDEDENEVQNCYSLEGQNNIEDGSLSASLFMNLPSVLTSLTTFTEENFNNIWQYENVTLKELNEIYKYIFEKYNGATYSAFEFRSDIKPEKWFVFESNNGTDTHFSAKDDSDDNSIYVEVTEEGSTFYKRYSSETKINLLNYLYPIARMFFFVTRSTDSYFSDNFDNYFNRDYAFLYYINLISLGQVDNLGKNSMFDTWDGIHWFIRPYDLDSQCGLTNTGQNTIKTYEEFLNTEVFPSGNVSYRTDLNELVSDIQDSQEIDNTLQNKNYHSKSSILWNRIWTNFKDNINNFYALLRKNYYSPEAIIQNAKREIIDKIPENQYNIDFRNKYLGTGFQRLGFGDRWDNFRAWVTNRFVFSDSYFGYVPELFVEFPNSNNPLRVKINIPEYFSVSDDKNFSGRQLALEYLTVNNTGVAQKVRTNLDAIIEIQNINKLSSFHIQVDESEQNFGYTKKLNNLLVLDLSDTKNINSLSDFYNNPNFLHTLDISRSQIKNIGIIPDTLQNLYANNTEIALTETNNEQQIVSKFGENSKIKNLQLQGFSGALILSDLKFLETIDLTNATLSRLVLSDLPNLTSINLTGCKFVNSNNQDNLTYITIENIFNKLSNLDFSNADFGNCALSISDDRTLSTVTNGIALNLTGVTNLQLLDISALLTLSSLDCSNSSIQRIITGNSEFTKLKRFICSPEIEEINVSESSAGSNPKCLNLEKFSSFTTGSNVRVSFKNCSKIEEIHNLHLGNSSNYVEGSEVFRNCNNLRMIDDSSIFIKNCIFTFADCWNLSDISSIQINTQSVYGMFAKAHMIAIDKAIDIINTTSTKIRQYDGVFAFKQNFLLSNNTGWTVNSKTYNHYLDLDSLFQEIDTNYDQCSAKLICCNNRFTNISSSVYTSVAGGVMQDEEKTLLQTYGSGDYYDELNNLEAVKGSFPCDSLETVYEGFFSCKKLEYIESNKILNSKKTSRNYSLKNAAALFSGCDLKNISIPDTLFGNGNIVTDIVGIFANNSNLTYNWTNSNFLSICKSLNNISAIFAGCKNVEGNVTGFLNDCLNRTTLPEIFYMENVFANTKVQLPLNQTLYTGSKDISSIKFSIGGIFSKENVSDSELYPININFVNQLTFLDEGQNSSYPVSAQVRYYSGYQTSSIQLGVFQGCKNLVGTFNTDFYNKIKQRNCIRMFKNSDLSGFNTTSEINNIKKLDYTNCTEMFCNAIMPSNLTSLNFVNSNNTSNRIAKGVFACAKFSGVLDTLSFNDNYITDLSYAFAGSNISYNADNLQLPQYVVTTDYMFSGRYNPSFGELTDKGSIDGYDIYKFNVDKYYRINYCSSSTQREYQERNFSGMKRFNDSDALNNISGSSIELKSTHTNTPLSSLKYTRHMFDSSQVAGISGKLLEECPNLVDCSFMFSNCNNLSTIQAKDGDSSVFSNDEYKNLIDVSGMFRKTKLNGVISISLQHASNVKYADYMFERLTFDGYTSYPLTLNNIFSENNTQLVSIVGFACMTNINIQDNQLMFNTLSNILYTKNLKYMDYAFVYTEDTNEAGYAVNIFTGPPANKKSNILSMAGLFAGREKITSTNIGLLEFYTPTMVNITGNFINSNLSGTNISTNSSGNYYQYNTSLMDTYQNKTV